MPRKRERKALFAPVFRTIISEVNADSVRRLAQEWFGLSGDISLLKDSISIFGDGRLFQQFTATGAVMYLDQRALDESAERVELIPNAALDLALAFLTKIERAPQAISAWRVKPGEVKLDDEHKIVNHVVVDIVPCVRIADESGITKDVPMLGGALVRVLIGAQDAVVGLALHWPELAQEERTELLGIRQARALLAYASAYAENHRGERHAAPAGHDVAGDGVLAYWFDGPCVHQPRVAPVYVLGNGGHHGGPAVVPATRLLPVARIKPMKPAKAGASPRFKAEVKNGMPSYRYHWYVMPGGTAEETASGPVYARPLEPGAQYLRLEVTDARGGRAETALEIVALTEIDARLATPPVVAAIAKSQESGRLELPAGVEALSRRVADHFYEDGGRRRECDVCNDPVTDPQPTVLNLPVAAAGWTMSALITPNDGMELRNIRYLGALVASSFSVPFYYAETTLMPWQRAELNHPPAANPHGNCRSWLLAPGIALAPVVGGGVAVVARWCVDRMPAPARRPLMVVEERFEFGPAVRTMAPPPFNLLVEAPFFPLVTHRFFPTAANTLRRIEFNYRLDFDIATAADQVALTSEANAPFPPPVFVAVSNPVPVETSGIAVGAGGVPGAAGAWDSYHQAPDYNALAPGLAAAVRIAATAMPGYNALRLAQFLGLLSAPNFPLPIIVPFGSLLPNDCVHVHWRWAAFLAALGFAPPGGGVGGATAAPGQLVEVYVVRYNVGERDPVIVNQLLNGQATVGQDLVFWYRAMSIGKLVDTFFRHGGFFV